MDPGLPVCGGWSCGCLGVEDGPVAVWGVEGRPGAAGVWRMGQGLPGAVRGVKEQKSTGKLTSLKLDSFSVN